MELVVKNLSANARDIEDQVNPRVRWSPWRREWQQQQRSLVGDSPWGNRVRHH